MEVRLLGAGDEANYLALRIKSIEESPELAAPEILRELNTAWAGGLLRAYCQERQCVLGAFYRGSLAGAIALNANLDNLHQHEIQVWGLYVIPRLRGTPISQALLEAAIAWCRQQRGKVTASVWFPKSNLQAFRFFDRNYFSVRADSMEESCESPAAHNLIFMEYFLGT